MGEVRLLHGRSDRPGKGLQGGHDRSVVGRLVLRLRQDGEPALEHFKALTGDVAAPSRAGSSQRGVP